MAEFPLRLDWTRRADGLLPVLRVGPHDAPPTLAPAGQAAISGVRLTAWPPGGAAPRVLQWSWPLAGEISLPLGEEAVAAALPLSAAGRPDPLPSLPPDGTWVISLEYVAQRQRTTTATYAVTLPDDPALTLWVEREGVWMVAPTGLEGGTLTASGGTLTWTHAASRRAYARWARRSVTGQVADTGTIAPLSPAGTAGWQPAISHALGGSSVAITVAPLLRRRCDKALLACLMGRQTPPAELMLADALLSALELADADSPLGYAAPILSQLEALLPDD